MPINVGRPDITKNLIECFKHGLSETFLLEHLKKLDKGD